MLFYKCIRTQKKLTISNKEVKASLKLREKYTMNHKNHINLEIIIILKIETQKWASINYKAFN